ncbi:MAG: hypothetical protein KC729_07010, partial [Candidatus Eisenbacteria bacterium]|nr:hypothetical protein [Candidatus Eisenbacteria bacterium]
MSLHAMNLHASIPTSEAPRAVARSRIARAARNLVPLVLALSFLPAARASAQETTRDRTREAARLRGDAEIGAILDSLRTKSDTLSVRWEQAVAPVGWSDPDSG